MKKLIIIFAALLIANLSFAQREPVNLPPGLTSIKDADLKRDIFELAGDDFRGRRAGTIDEFRAAAWVAQRAMEAGLKPAGADGTYFQFYNIKRTVTSSKSFQ